MSSCPGGGIHFVGHVLVADGVLERDAPTQDGAVQVNIRAVAESTKRVWLVSKLLHSSGL